MAGLNATNIIGPNSHQTIVGLRKGLRDSGMRKYYGIVSQVFVDGANIGTAVPRDQASKIKYKIALVGEDRQFDPSTPAFAPSNRKLLSKIRIIGSKVGDPVEVYDYGGNLYVKIDEVLDPYGCNGLPVED